jgi:hypothetical protein
MLALFAFNLITATGTKNAFGQMVCSSLSFCTCFLARELGLIRRGLGQWRGSVSKSEYTADQEDEANVREVFKYYSTTLCEL